MTWNYRVMKHVTEHPLHQKDPINIPKTYTWYGIHEVFYENGYTADPIDLTADNLEDLKSIYRMIGEAFKKPTLDYKENG